MPAKTTLWAVVCVVSGIGGGLAGHWVTNRTLEGPLGKLDLVTPVFVLDRSAVIKGLPPDASRETIDRAMKALREKADRLAASGYLVIDAGLVVAAPEDVYVRDPN